MDNLSFSWIHQTHAQKIERWENVLRVLNTMPEHDRQRHWDMGSFGYKDKCGTIACAAGHCGLDPWFRERGFELNFEFTGAELENGAPDPEDEKDPNCWDEQIGDVENFFGDAGSQIFFNASPRSVERVIREVTFYLEALINDEDADPFSEQDIDLLFNEE